MARQLNPAISEFILRSVSDNPGDVTPMVVEKFGITRQAANTYLQRLVRTGLLDAEGKTKARVYKLKPIVDMFYQLKLADKLEEHIIFREKILPNMQFVRSNLVDIIEYGFNEMMNNVIDHSGAETCWVSVKRDYAKIAVTVEDDGIGIFEKIRRECGLDDRRSALLELSKGKLTTDREKHTGEGIFFTSRMFDRFYILSSDLYYSRKKTDHWDWLIETEKRDQEVTGTTVGMEVATDSSITSKEVFERYVDDEDRFIRTHVSLILAKYEGENLVSRSQARRLLKRVERFRDVVLDFRNIPEIGRAFADEIFRVFQREHPEITFIPVNTTDPINKIIDQARANAFAQEELSSVSAAPEK